MPRLELPIETPSPTRSRGFLRLLSIGAIASCGVFFMCAGCCVLTMFLFFPHVDATREGAETAASKITDWKLPESFEGKSGVTIDNMFMRFDIALYAHREGRGVLIIEQLHTNLMTYEQKQTYLKDTIERISPELKKIDLNEHETRTLVIREVPSQFEIGRGEDRASTTKYRQVTGHFRGKLDDAVLILQGEEGFLTDQEIDEFLNSIK